VFATLSDVKIAPADVETYIEMRRLHINPTLREQPGFQGSVLLKAREQPGQDELTFALFNFWADAEAAAAWAVAPVHDEVSEYVIPLVRSITSKRYERVEAASITHADESRARMARIAYQQIKPNRMQEYLDYRRDVIHKSMSDAAGFVSAWTFRDAADPNLIAIFFQWESDEAADAYFHQPFHLGEITDRVTEMIDSKLIAGARYDVIPIKA
jgi:heme-degrading monooxygenase HmoA